MEQTQIIIKFSQARASYIEVRNFLEQETGDKVTSLDMDIEEGLKIAGGDTYELIGKFMKRYGLQSDGLDISNHFLSEGEQFNSGIALAQLIYFPFVLIFYFIKFFTLGRIDLTNVSLTPESGRKTTGMTFGDLVTWHLAGNFRLRNETRITLQHGA